MDTKGTFYVIATPIGNLSDISYRAIETLRALDVLYCEDTRTTSILLKRYDVFVPHIRSFHSNSNIGQINGIIKELGTGKSIGYVSDAGTPGISDPGSMLVSHIRESGMNIKVIPIPGVSAVITLLSASGFDTHQYFYRGFLPTKKGRNTMIRDMVESEVVNVCYESVHRFPRMLEEFALLETDFKIRLCVGREMTKIYETFYIDTPSALVEYFKNNEGEVRGEFAIAVESRKKK